MAEKIVYDNNINAEITGQHTITEMASSQICKNDKMLSFCRQYQKVMIKWL